MYGAVCVEEVQPNVTHLVASQVGTAKVNEALKKSNVYVVAKSWMLESLSSMKRADENLHRLQDLPVLKEASQPPLIEKISPLDDDLADLLRFHSFGVEQPPIDVVDTESSSDSELERMIFDNLQEEQQS